MDRGPYGGCTVSISVPGPAAAAATRPISSVMAWVVLGLTTRMRISRPLSEHVGGEPEPQQRAQHRQAAGHDQQVDRAQAHLAEEHPRPARLLGQVQPSQLHGHGDVLAATDGAQPERHRRGDHAREEDQGVEGAEGVGAARPERALDDHELLLDQGVEPDGEGEHEGHLVGQPPAVHGHPPLEGLGGHGVEDEGEAHGAQPKAEVEPHPQPRPGGADPHRPQLGGPEVGRSLDQEEVDQGDGRHDRQHQEDERVVLGRGDAGQGPDGQDEEEEEDPGLGHEEADQQVADDEDQLGAGVQVVQEGVLAAELVERPHRPATSSEEGASRATASSTLSGRGSSPSRLPRAVIDGGLTWVRRSSASSRNTASGSPKAISSPSQSTATRSQWAATRDMAWVMTTTVRPSSRAIRTSRRMMAWDSWRSWPVVGSSITITDGCMATIEAMARRWRPPLERRKGWRWRTSQRSSARSTRSARSSAWARSRPRFRGPKITSSSTGSLKIWWSGFWKT